MVIEKVRAGEFFPSPSNRLRTNFAMLAYRTYEASQWLPRNPLRILLGGAVLGGGVAVAERIANPPVLVEAATPNCNVKLLVLGFGFIDNPNVPNRLGLLDAVDFVVGAPEFGEAVVVRPKDPNKPTIDREEITRGRLSGKADHAQILFDITAPSNARKDNKDALNMRVYFADDKVKQADNTDLPVDLPITLTCGGRGNVRGGRYSTLRAIQDTAKSTQYNVFQVGTRVDQITKEVFGVATGIAPKIDSPTDNLKSLKASLLDIEVRAKDVREKELSKIPSSSTGKGNFIPPPENNPSTAINTDPNPSQPVAQKNDSFVFATISPNLEDIKDAATTPLGALVVGIGLGAIAFGGTKVWRR